MTTRPSKQEIAGAYGKRIPDVIAPGLRVLFCGINPSLYSAAVGHHFARPGNRFWKALHLGGFTERVLTPFEDRGLLKAGLGLTNLVARATATAAELDEEEIRDGARRLTAKVRRYRPGIVAVLGLGAYRTGFGDSRAAVGRQAQTLGDARLWVLPNPSGLNASWQLPRLQSVFGQLRIDAETQHFARFGFTE